MNDGDDDLEEDVFEDPGFQEEFDFDSDKENDDCIEITNPGINISKKTIPFNPSKVPAGKGSHIKLMAMIFFFPL